jgi:hypothetical protein
LVQEQNPVEKGTRSTDYRFPTRLPVAVSALFAKLEGNEEGERMSPTLADFHERYQRLQQARGPERRAACRAFCVTVIGAQRRGEIGILPAIGMIEEALQAPVLQADEALTRLWKQAADLQATPGQGDHDRVTAWRVLVKGIEELSA